MKKTLILALSLLASTALAQMPTVESAPMEKASPGETKKAILVTVGSSDVWTCKDGFDMYVQRVRPKESKDPESTFRGYFWISPPMPNQPNTGMVTSRPGNEVIGACLRVK